MSRVARVALPQTLVLLQISCHQSGPSPIPTATAAPAVREGYVDAGGAIRLYYRLVGAAADTVVVLHGGPGFSMEYFAGDLEPLAAGHTLLFYDQRGTGRSSLVTDSIDLDAQRFADDLEAVRSQFGLARLTLLGHSWGAGLAAIYASRYPHRVGRLIVVGSLPLQQKGLIQAFQKLADGRDSLTRHQMLQWREARLANPGDAAACRAYYVLWFRPFFRDTAAANRSRGDFCAGTAEARRNKIASVDRFTMASLGEWDWRASLHGIAAPALVILGTADVFPVASGREWAAAIPNARLLLLEGVGHFPYLEAPEAFFAAVDTFLRGSWPRGAETVAAP